MGMVENVHEEGQGEMNQDATHGGDVNGGQVTGENASRILAPQVPRIIPRFMGGKHIRGMGEGYQRRFTPKTFHIPGEEPSQPPPRSPGKTKQEEEVDDLEGHVVESEADPTKDPAVDVSPTRVTSKRNTDDDDDDENAVPLAPIWERPTR